MLPLNPVDELADSAARDAVCTQLDDTLFVEAGAGTGKTAVLVERIVALVTVDGASGPIAMRAVAAITFAEKAAAELRDRVRRRLEQRAQLAEPGSDERERCLVALDELDAAAICTLHAFAQRILTQFPIEAGLPPRIAVRDEISSRVAFETRWRELVDELLDEPELEQPILFMLAAGVKLDHLRAVAEVLDDNWDLLDRVTETAPLPALEVDAWLRALDEVCALAGDCASGDDKLVLRLGDLGEYGARIRNAFDDVERVQLLKAAKPSFSVRATGRKPNWSDIATVRERVGRLGEQRDVIVNRVLEGAIRLVVAALARATASAVAARRVEGELEFHDLLVLARSLLRDPLHGARARNRLRQKYRVVLVDEFQDTDPIQVDLAALLASPAADDAGRPWYEMAVDPGRLFFVGDPKQSIYRFRRADIGTFLTAAEHYADPAPVYLTCNFRTTPDVLAWVNTVFAELIRPVPGSQPEYRPLDP